MKTFQSYKAFILCILGLFLSFIANYTGHLSDLSFAIVGIISVFVTGQAGERGSAFFAASRDPNCDTANVIHGTLGNQQSLPQNVTTFSDIVSDVESLITDIKQYVEGSDKAIDEDDDNEDDNANNN